MDKAFATETVDLRSILDQVKSETKNWYSQLSCLTLSVKRDSAKHALCMVERWAGGSLTLRSKGPFAVSWSRQLGE